MGSMFDPTQAPAGMSPRSGPTRSRFGGGCVLGKIGPVGARRRSGHIQVGSDIRRRSTSTTDSSRRSSLPDSAHFTVMERRQRTKSLMRIGGTPMDELPSSPAVPGSRPSAPPSTHPEVWCAQHAFDKVVRQSRSENETELVAHHRVIPS